jgi:hypothetical protein
MIYCLGCIFEVVSEGRMVGVAGKREGERAMEGVRPGKGEGW